MATADALRDLVRALADTEERSHMGHPDFRVGGKIFGGLTADEKEANLKLPPDVQASVLGSSDAFRPAAGAWGRRGWTTIVLAEVPVPVLAELVGEAWRLVRAPATKKTKSATKKPAKAKAKATSRR